MPLNWQQMAFPAVPWACSLAGMEVEGPTLHVLQGLKQLDPVLMVELISHLMTYPK
jgi:hypothetical protein